MKRAGAQIYSEIDAILWLEWDPLGVNEFVEARDEYQGYIDPIFYLIKCSAPVESITKHLYNIEMVEMGLFADQSRCSRVAERLYGLISKESGI